MEIGWNVLVRQFCLYQAECEEPALRVLMEEGTCLRTAVRGSLGNRRKFFLYGCFDETV